VHKKEAAFENRSTTGNVMQSTAFTMQVAHRATTPTMVLTRDEVSFFDQRRCECHVISFLN
jgi:hypothetical protein